MGSRGRPGSPQRALGGSSPQDNTTTTGMIQKLLAYAITAAAVTILLSSTARIGLAILSSDSVHIDFDVDIDNEDEPILPIHQRKLAVSRGESGPGGVSDVLPGLLQMSSSTKKIDESKLPYKCGVILYDNSIPGEGGGALNEWIKELVQSNDKASLISSGEQESKSSFVSQVEEQIQSIGPRDWKIVSSHEKNGLAFATDEKILSSWRKTVERQNCHFISAAIFSDVLDHSIKHTKKRFTECDCSMEEFKEKIMEVVTENPWTGQLDHFLFNSGDASSMEMKDKVKRGMQLLKDHFEIVMVDGNGDFAAKLLSITGWSSSRQVKKASVSDGGLLYSKELVSKYGKMSTKNGDADFIDAVSHVYHSSLDYLMLQ